MKRHLIVLCCRVSVNSSVNLSSGYYWMIIFYIINSIYIQNSKYTKWDEQTSMIWLRNCINESRLPIQYNNLSLHPSIHTKRIYMSLWFYMMTELWTRIVSMKKISYFWHVFDPRLHSYIYVLKIKVVCKENQIENKQSSQNIDENMFFWKRASDQRSF